MDDEEVMTIHPDIEEFIRQLELYAGLQLNYPLEVGELMQIAAQTGLTDEFEELIFHAKFLVRTQEVMKRIGPGAEGFERLSTEFQSGMQKSLDILKSLAGRAPEEAAQKFTSNFSLLEADSFHQLMKLPSDLSQVKNWQIDGKPLPYTGKRNIQHITQTTSESEPAEKKRKTGPGLPSSRIKRIAVLAVVIGAFLLLIDPPVTILGWILSLWIMVLLVYIVLEAHALNKTPKP